MKALCLKTKMFGLGLVCIRRSRRRRIRGKTICPPRWRGNI